MRIAVIEDDDAAGDSLKTLIEEIYEDTEVRVFKSTFDAKDWPADIALIDVSAVSPLGWGQHSYAPICSYMDLHPGMKVVVTSALPASHFKSVADDIRKAIPDARVEHRSMLGDLDWIDQLQ